MMQANRHRPGKALLLWALVLLVSLAAGCGSQDESGEKAGSDRERLAKARAMYQDYKKDFPGVKDVSPLEAMSLLHDGKALMVDVREPEEQEVSMIPGAMAHRDFLRNPKAHQGKTLIAYCTISYRSGEMAEELAEEGIEVLNLRDGLLGWLHAGGEVHKDGKPVKRVHVYGSKWDLAPLEYEAVY